MNEKFRSGEISQETGSSSFTSGSADNVPNRTNIVSLEKAVRVIPSRPEVRSLLLNTKDIKNTNERSGVSVTEGVSHGLVPNIPNTYPENQECANLPIEPVQIEPGIIPGAGHAEHPIMLDPDALNQMHPTDRLIVEMDARGVPVSQIGLGIGKSTSGARWRLSSAKKAYRRALGEGI